MANFSERELWILSVALAESTGFGQSASADLADESEPGIESCMVVNDEVVRVKEVANILRKLEAEFDNLEGRPD